MKKLDLVFVFVAFFGLFALFTKTASASDYGSAELNRSNCNNAVGKAIIDVKQKVFNDADSGVAGNVWAFDKYKREIKVFRTTTDNAFCAIVKYDGKFVTNAGASPQNTGTVGAGIKGKFEGGYRATFTGTEKSDPLKKTKGNIGTYN